MEGVKYQVVGQHMNQIGMMAEEWQVICFGSIGLLVESTRNEAGREVRDQIMEDPVCYYAT